MSNKSGYAAGEYLRSAWDEQKVIEEDYACIVEISLHPTERKGVYCFHFEAYGPVVDVGLMAPLGRLKALFPNADTKTLEGFFFGQLIKLHNMVREVRGDDWAAPRGAFQS